MRITCSSQLIPYAIKQASLMEWADRNKTLTGMLLGAAGSTKQAGLLKSIGGFVRKLNYAPVRDAQHAILNARIDKGLADLAAKPGRPLAPGHADIIRQQLLRSLDEVGPRVLKPIPLWDATKRRLDMELLGLGNSLQDSLVPPLTAVFRSGLPAGSRALYRDYGRALKAHNDAWGRTLGVLGGASLIPLDVERRRWQKELYAKYLSPALGGLDHLGNRGKIWDELKRVKIWDELKRRFPLHQK